MRYQPVHAVADGRSPSPLRPLPWLRAALAILATVTLGLLPAVFVATPAFAAPGQVTIDSDIEANEDDAFVFEVRREGPSGSPLTLNFDTIAAVTGGGVYGATPDVDFVRTHGTTTFQASNNNVVKRFTVQGKSDLLDEYDETFVFQLRDVSNNIVASANGILDDLNDTPTYTLAANPNPVPEAGNHVRITATLTATTGRDVTIPISTTDGTASSTAGEDYTATSTNLTVLTDASTGYIDIPITDDIADDLTDETFAVAGAAGDNGQANTGGDVTVHITDDDPTPSVTVGSASVVSEGTNLSFPITLSAASHLPITVLASTSDVTATSADYTSVASQMVSFAPGDTSKAVTVTTTDDNLNELQESVRLTLTGPTNAVAGTMTATGNINDTPDVPPGVTMDPASVAEGDAGSVEHTFNVHLDADSGRTVRIGYQVNSNTAGAADFEVVDQSDSGILTFAPGDRLKTFKVKVYGDRIHEGDETFNVVLNDIDTALTAGGALGTNAITITDDDAIPVLQTITTVTHAEGNTGSSTVNMRVSISNPDKNAITLSVTNHDGTATSTGANPGDNDFSQPAVNATITAGATYVDLPISITGDTVYEGDESATVEVNSGGTTGGPQTGTVTITDEDPVPTVTLSSRSGLEGTSIAVEATVSGVAQRAISITLAAAGYSNNGSSMAQPEDFDASGLSATQIPGGDQTGGPVALGSIAVLDDLIDEPDQTVRVTLGGGTLSATAIQTLLDAANDLPPAVSVGASSAAENVGTMNVPATVAFDNAGNAATSTEVPVVVHYKTTNGTAVAPGDFTAVTDNTATIAPGAPGTNLPVTIIDDDLYEVDETYTVTLLSAAPTGATIGTATATQTILANDSVSKPSFSINNVTRAEDAAGTADFTVTLNRVSSQDVHLDVTAHDGSAVDATAGPGSDDYDAPAATLTIPANSLTGTFHVTVHPDQVFEGTETATFEITPSSGENGLTVGSPVVGTLTLTNDDTAPTLTLAPADVAEGANLDVDAVVTGVAQDNITYYLTLSGDSTGNNDPAETIDYTDSHSTATLTGGTASGSHVSLRMVPIITDYIDENNESLKVVVTDGASNPVASAVYTILDSPTENLPSAAIGDVVVNEADGNAQLTVTLAFGGGNTATATERTISIGYATQNGTARAGTDFTAPASGAALTFGPSVISRTIDIPIADDGVWEPAEDFVVKLTSISPTGATIADDTGTVTINESNVGAKPSWTLGPAQTVQENVQGGKAVFTIDLSGPSSIPVTFNVGVNNGTAVESGSTPGANDFDLPATPLTIAAGDLSASIEIPITNDAVYEANENATVTAAIVGGGAAGATGSPQSSVLTIGNDDAKPTITLNQNVTQDEGTTVAIQATLHGQAQAGYTFGLTVAPDGSAGHDPAEGGDYNAAGAVSGSIAAGAPDGTVTDLGSIVFNNDTIDEAIESVAVTATDQSADLSPASAVYQIGDDPNDLPPAISLGDQTVDENVGTVMVPVTLAYVAGNGANATERDTVIRYKTTAVTASDALDYTGTTGTDLTITAGQPSGTIMVAIQDDSIYERDETFTVDVISRTPSESVLTRGSAVVKINRNDTDFRTGFTVEAGGANEDTGGGHVTIKLDAPTTAPVTFTASVAPGTATTGGTTPGSNDYMWTPPASLEIPVGAQTVNVPVTFVGDDVYENDETLTVTVALAGNEDNAVGGQANALLTVLNDDAKPHVTLNSGDSGTEGTDITVVATADRTAQATVNFALTFSGDSSGTNVAAGDADYVDSHAPASIPGGTPAGTPLTFRTFRLSNDKIDEPIETVKVVASDTNDVLADATALYSINDDPNDQPPSVSIDDLVVGEGDGNANVQVNLTFDPTNNDATSTTRPVTVTYSTTSGTATAGSDFTGTTGGTLPMAAGAAGGTIVVPITNDLRDEPAEAFTVRITAVSPPEARISDNSATVTIDDNDADVAKPDFSVEHVSEPEGNAAHDATFTVTLTEAAQDAVSFTVNTTDGTATDGSSLPEGGTVGANDYNPPLAGLTIPQGQLTGQVKVPVNGDSTYEGAETAYLTVSLAEGERDAEGEAKEATLTLQNDDALPTVALSSTSAPEGDDIDIAGTVTGSTQVDAPVTLTFAGDDSGTNNPAEEADYDDSDLTRVIRGGTSNGGRVGLGALHIKLDMIDEPTETIRVSSPDSAGETKSWFYRITDSPDNEPPTVSVSSESIGEGLGSVDLMLSLAYPNDMTDATDYDVSVPWSTFNGSAKSGTDYTAKNEWATIEAGMNTSEINVPIIDDELFEGTQVFYVKLGTPSPGAVKVDTGTGSVEINDNDEAPNPTIQVVESRNGAGAVTVSGMVGESASVQLFSAPLSNPTKFTLAATTTASITGVYSFSRTIEMGYNLYTRASGKNSVFETVKVVQVPTLTATSTVKGTVVLTATGNPKTAGQAVQMQRQNTNGTWSNLAGASGKLTSAGTYTVTLKSLKSGTAYTYRAYLPGTPGMGILAGTSAARKVTVR